MSNRTFLDIDDTILKQNLILPGNVTNDDNVMKQSDSVPFFIIQPTPGLCVKAKSDANEKVFINICTSDKIPQPEDISDAKLFEILTEENPQFVIPMSIGSERLEPDKGGSPCMTYDVAINSTYFAKCEKNKNFLLFTISVIMDGISNKFNKTLNTEDYVILKNRKVMGKLQQHRIENREARTSMQTHKPLIEEIKGSARDVTEERDKVSLSKHVFPDSVCNTKFNYILLKQPLEGPAIKLIGLFDMPKGIISKEVDVVLDQDRVVITIEKSGLTYDISVPYAINVGNAKCFLDKDLRVLRIDMPVENVLNNIPAI